MGIIKTLPQLQTINFGNSNRLGILIKSSLLESKLHRAVNFVSFGYNYFSWT